MHEHFDGQKAFEHIARLAEMRRLPGTPGEKKARDYIREAGDGIGVEMETEEFSYSSMPLKFVLPLLFLLLAATCVLGSLTYLWGTALTAVPGAALLIMVYVGQRWPSGFERFGARGGRERSANIVGEVKAAEPAGTVLLSAHYDSKSQLMPVVVRAGFYIFGFSSAVLLGATLVVVGIMDAAGVDVLGDLPGFFVTLIPVFFLLMLVFNFTGNRSPGALDNASGEAVILEMARVLAKHPPRHLDVRVVSFGCEEIGLCGSVCYLLEHEAELKARPFYMLNFDMPFSPGGMIAINTGFEVPPRYTSAHLNELARKAAEEMGFELRGIFLPVGAAADHMPWSKHGLEATGFVSAATHVHRPTDSVDKINREALRRTGEIALAVVRALDQEMSAEPS